MRTSGMALLASLLALSACSRPHPDPAPGCSELDAGTPVDPLLLAFLSRARAAHHLADAHEGAGDLPAAIAALAGLVAGPLPREKGAQLLAEVREVLADTHARLADLRSRAGDFGAALTAAHAGLEVSPDPNYFRGHLLETEGLVEERHANALEKSDPVAAAAVRKRAIGLLEQAMAVQSEVIQNAPSPRKRNDEKPATVSASPAFPAASALPTPAPAPPAKR